MTDKIDRKKLYIPAVAPIYETLGPYSYTLVRIALGLILLPHGFPKLFLDDAIPTSRNFVNFGWSHPLAWAYFIGCIEFIGGIMMVIGLYTRAVAVAFIIQMSVIAFAVLAPNWGWGKRGMEYVVFIGVIAIAVLLGGGGRYSVDSYLKKTF
jgi:putative oxidoreductase